MRRSFRVLVILFALSFLCGNTLFAGDSGLTIPVGERCLPVLGPFRSLCNVLPKPYARVVDGPVPVYGGEDVPDLTHPKRWLKKGFVWVSLESPVVLPFKGREWLVINQGEFVEKRHLAFHEPILFRGIELDGMERGPFLWVILNTTPSRRPGEAGSFKAVELPRYSLFEVLDVKRVNGWNWYKIGDDMWIEQRRVALVEPRERPGEVGEHEKWIYMNLYEQTLTAYQGDKMVYATLISSGVKQFPTVKGLFRIWQKVEMAKMSGGEGKPNYYYLEDVPWQMYLHQGYAIHTSYWHDWFGFPQSHGCVNVAPYDSWWLFNWSEPVPRPGQNRTYATKQNPGTWVYVQP